MSDIRIMERSIFTQFWYGDLMVQSIFGEHQCMPIQFYLFSDLQCASLIFHESLNYLIIILTIMSGIGIIKRSVFTQFWYGEFNGAF